MIIAGLDLSNRHKSRQKTFAVISSLFPGLCVATGGDGCVIIKNELTQILIKPYECFIHTYSVKFLNMELLVYDQVILLLSYKLVANALKFYKKVLSYNKDKRRSHTDFGD